MKNSTMNGQAKSTQNLSTIPKIKLPPFAIKEDITKTSVSSKSKSGDKIDPSLLRLNKIIVQSHLSTMTSGSSKTISPTLASTTTTTTTPTTKTNTLTIPQSLPQLTLQLNGLIKKQGIPKLNTNSEKSTNANTTVASNGATYTPPKNGSSAQIASTTVKNPLSIPTPKLKQPSTITPTISPSTSTTTTTTTTTSTSATTSPTTQSPVVIAKPAIKILEDSTLKKRHETKVTKGLSESIEKSVGKSSSTPTGRIDFKKMETDKKKDQSTTRTTTTTTTTTSVTNTATTTIATTVNTNTNTNTTTTKSVIKEPKITPTPPSTPRDEAPPKSVPPKVTKKETSSSSPVQIKLDPIDLHKIYPLPNNFKDAILMTEERIANLTKRDIHQNLPEKNPHYAYYNALTDMSRGGTFLAGNPIVIIEQFGVLIDKFEDYIHPSNVASTFKDNGLSENGGDVKHVFSDDAHLILVWIQKIVHSVKEQERVLRIETNADQLRATQHQIDAPCLSSRPTSTITSLNENDIISQHISKGCNLSMASLPSEEELSKNYESLANAYYSVEHSPSAHPLTSVDIDIVIKCFYVMKNADLILIKYFQDYCDRFQLTNLSAMQDIFIKFLADRTCGGAVGLVELMARIDTCVEFVYYFITYISILVGFVATGNFHGTTSIRSLRASSSNANYKDDGDVVDQEEEIPLTKRSKGSKRSKTDEEEDEDDDEEDEEEEDEDDDEPNEYDKRFLAKDDDDGDAVMGQNDDEYEPGANSKSAEEEDEDDAGSGEDDNE